MFNSNFEAQYQAMLAEARSYRDAIENQPRSKKEARRRHWALGQLATKSTQRSAGDWAHRLPRSVRRAGWRQAMRAANLLGGV